MPKSRHLDHNLEALEIFHFLFSCYSKYLLENRINTDCAIGSRLGLIQY